MKSLTDSRRDWLKRTLMGMGGLAFPSRFAYSDESIKPYKRMFDDGLEFTGPDDAYAGDEIRIGLFSPPPEDGSVAEALVNGAQVAVDAFNAAEPERPMRLIRRWADDPWGAGSKEIIRLAYQDRVMAIIGGPDSATTHLLQQIALKAHLPVLSPVASDHTLTEIRVPWVFRLPPGEKRMAFMLAGALEQHSQRIAMLYSDAHDARMSASVFKRELSSAESSPVFEAVFPENESDLATVAERAASFSPDAVWIWARRRQRKELMKWIEAHSPDTLILFPYIPDMAVDDEFENSDLALLISRPFIEQGGRKQYEEFISGYSRYETSPLAPACYAYDAVGLIAQAIKCGAASRKQLREAIASLSDFIGAAGQYRWDNGGGNMAEPSLLEIAPAKAR